MKHTMNFFTFLVLFIVSVLFLVMPVSAVNDDFNDGIFLDEWVIVSGTWSVINTSSLEGSDDYYLYGSGTTSVVGVEDFTYEIYDIFYNDDPGYIEFDFNTVSEYQNENSYAKESFLFGTDADQIGFSVKGSLATNNRTVTFEGFTLDSYTSIVDDNWYHIEFILGAVNINVKIYDSNGNMLYDKSGAYTKPTFEKFILEPKVIENDNQNGYTSTIRIDNIITSGIPPGTESGINWDKSQYTEGETASYTWVLENSFWQDLIYKYRIQILKDGVEIDTVRVSQTGTRYLDVGDAGTYEVKLQYSGLIFTNWESIDSDSVNVIPQADSYINVPQTAPQRTNFTVNYLYGSTPSNGLILMKRLDETTGIYETVGFDLLGTDKQGGTSYSRNMSLHSTGTYKITLIHDEQVKEIYDVIKITSLYVPPIETVGDSSIDSDKVIYAIGETIFAQYAVDYTNFTTYNVNMEVYNIDKDVISYSVPTIDQISYISQTIPITNEYFIGSHTLRLTSYDHTGTKVAVLASKNITIGLANDDGFGLSLSKYDVMQLETFVIKVVCPTSSNIRVWNVERDGQVGGLITVNGSTYLNYAIPCTGNYEITLSSGGFEIAKQYITVHEGFVDGGVDDEIEDDYAQFDTSFESMLSSGSFVALLIIIACVGAFGKIGGVVGVFLGMVVGISISFLMGYLPPWILFVMVLALCVVFVSKLINSFGGGE